MSSMAWAGARAKMSTSIPVSLGPARSSPAIATLWYCGGSREAEAVLRRPSTPSVRHRPVQHVRMYTSSERCKQAIKVLSANALGVPKLQSHQLTRPRAGANKQNRLAALPGGTSPLDAR